MIRTFFKDGFIYAVPSLISRAIGLVLLPIYTRYLSPEDYGLVEILTILYALLNLTLPLEVSQGVARLVPSLKDKNKKKQYISTAFWFTACCFFLFVIFCWVFPKQLSELLLQSPGYVLELRVASLAMFANSLLYLVQNNLRWCLQAKQSALVAIIFIIVTAIVTVLLLIVLKMGVIGVLYGQMLGSLVALLFAIYYTNQFIPIEFLFNFTRLKEMLIFSFPLVFSSMAVYVSIYADRWLLSSMLDLSSVGIYSVAFKLAMVIGLICYSFQMALVPLIYTHYKDEHTPFYISRIFNYFLLLILPLLAFVSAFSKDIVYLFAGESFQDAHILMLPLSFSVLFLNIYFFSPGLSIAKKTIRIAMINIVAGVVNITLNIILIPHFKELGAAVATLSGGISMTILYFWFGNKEYKIPYDYLKCLAALLIFGTFLLLYKVVSHSYFVSTGALILMSILIGQVLLTKDEKIIILNKVMRK